MMIHCAIFRFVQFPHASHLLRFVTANGSNADKICRQPG